jgi:hypothetical protein
MLSVLIIVAVFLISVLIVIRFRRSPATIGIVSCIKNPKNIETWLRLHRDFGVSRFYVRLEDTPGLVNFFESQPDVHLLVADSKSADEYADLMERQSQMVDLALELSKKDGIDWMIHIDCDEVLEGNPDEIRNLPSDVGTFWMQNYEAMYDKIPSNSDNCFKAGTFKNCATGVCASYANGKGGGRVGLSRSHGPHRFKSSLREVKLGSVIVKHYESCDFEQYIAKYKRLAKSDTSKIPFSYYKESIQADGDVGTLEKVYEKYRVNSSTVKSSGSEF